MSIGFRAFQEIPRPEANLIARLAAYDSADVSDAMRHAKTMIGIRATWDHPARIAGPAITASMPIGGVNVIRLAMEASQEGDVLVLAARGVQEYAVFGGYISQAMSKRGLAAIVVDGAVRDSEEIEFAKLPAFARGTATAACASEAPGEINVPVACGGVVVMPGDIIVGDRNGVVAVSPSEAGEVLEKLAGLEKRHESWGDDVANGRVPGIEETIARAKELDMEFVAGTYEAR